MRVAVVTHTGNSTDNRTISNGLGGSIANEASFVHATTNGRKAVFRTQANSGDQCMALVGGAWNSNEIQANGVAGEHELGTALTVNNTGEDYFDLFLLQDAAQVMSGTYTGSGVGQSITGVGFQPDIVIVNGNAGGKAVWKSNTMAAGDSINLGGGVLTDGITSIDADGFTVGTGLPANTAATTYRYLALKKKSGRINTFTYTGNGTDGRTVAHGLSGTPIIAFIQRNGNFNPCWRPSTAVGDVTYFPDNNAPAANYIQAMDATNLELGTDGQVNNSGSTYHAFAIMDDPPAGGAGQMGMLGVGA